MSEVNFWRGTVRPKLLPFGVLHRIENTVELGTPDVTYTLRRDKQSPAWSGWIETKYEHSWPAKDKTPFRFKKFTTDQAAWIYEWGNVGGKACVLANVGATYFLLPHQHVYEMQWGAPRWRVMEMAAVWANGEFPTGRIVKWLTERI